MQVPSSRTDGGNLSCDATPLYAVQSLLIEARSLWKVLCWDYGSVQVFFDSIFDYYFLHYTSYRAHFRGFINKAFVLEKIRENCVFWYFFTERLLVLQEDIDRIKNNHVSCITYTLKSSCTYRSKPTSYQQSAPYGGLVFLPVFFQERAGKTGR